jgi:hypothetical protein
MSRSATACVMLISALLAMVMMVDALPAGGQDPQEKKADEPKAKEEKKTEAKKTGDGDAVPAPAAPAQKKGKGKKSADNSAAKGDAEPKFQPPVTDDVEISFLNGSTVRMLIESESLDIATPYGKLTVPTKHLRAVEFGLHYPPGVEAKVVQAIKSLDSDNYQEREKATAMLIELGPYSFLAVLEASRAKDLEAASRATAILKKLQGKHPKKDLKTSGEDKVVTPTFTIVGHITSPTIRVKAEYFGENELNLSNMRALRSFSGARKDIEVVVDASRYGNPGTWMETSCIMDGRTEYTITAKGQVDTGGGQGFGPQAAAGPNGLMNRGGKKAAFTPGQKIGFINNNQHSGMLLGKIGEKGDPFFIGEHYEGTPDEEGTLYLHIGPSQWGLQSIGAYEVKITPK